MKVVEHIGVRCVICGRVFALRYPDGPDPYPHWHKAPDWAMECPGFKMLGKWVNETPVGVERDEA